MLPRFIQRDLATLKRAALQALTALSTGQTTDVPNGEDNMIEPI